MNASVPSPLARTISRMTLTSLPVLHDHAEKEQVASHWIRLLALRKPLARGCLWVQASIAVSDPSHPLLALTVVADDFLDSDAPIAPSLLTWYVSCLFSSPGRCVARG